MRIGLKTTKTKLAQLIKIRPTPLFEIQEAILEYITQGGNISSPVFRLGSQNHNLITLLCTIATKRREEFSAENSILDLISFTLRENYNKTQQKADLTQRVKFAGREMRAAEILLEYRNFDEASKAVIRNNQNASAAFGTVLSGLSRAEQQEKIEQIKLKVLRSHTEEFTQAFNPDNPFFKAGLEAAEELYKMFVVSSRTKQPVEHLFRGLSRIQARHFHFGIIARLTTDPKKKRAADVVEKMVAAVNFEYQEHLSTETTTKEFKATDFALDETKKKQYEEASRNYYEKLRAANTTEAKKLIFQQKPKPTSEEIYRETESASRFLRVILDPKSSRASLSEAIKSLTDINARFSYEGDTYPSRTFVLLEKGTLITPLQIAIMMGRGDAVELILQNPKVEISRKSSDGRNALHFAAEMPLFQISDKVEKVNIWNSLASFLENKLSQEDLKKILGSKSKKGLTCAQLFDHCNSEKFSDFLKSYPKISTTLSQLDRKELLITSIKASQLSQRKTDKQII